MIWIALATCLLVSFLFAGVEAGLLSINPVRLSHNVRLKAPGALRLQALLLHPQRLLITVLLVTNLLKICALVLITQLLRQHIGDWSYPVAFLIAIPVFVILLEMLPKSLFRRFPYRLLAPLSEMIRAVYWLLSPLIWLLTWIGKRIFRNEDTRDLFIAREELKDLTSEVEKSGTLDPAERAMIHNVVDFRAVLGRDVMIPMDRVAKVSPDTPVTELLGMAKEKGWDRFPVVAANGQIIGLVRSFEVLLDGRLHTSAQHHLRRIINVRVDEPATQIIRKLRAARMSLAAVLDENNRPVGVVRPEDLIDRLINVNVGSTRSTGPNPAMP
ncbi:MAG TPA: CNNM domain-containing protein [Chthoniobacterales bacterium]|jgi:CBS domain containing-hemolysin-like protein